MRIGMVTVYQSFNCGSFLQAYAIMRAVEKMGHEPIFFKNKVAKRAWLSYRLMQSAKYILQGQFKRAKHVIEVYKNFRGVERHFNVKPKNDDVALAIYGSDTIWDTTMNYFDSHWKRFYGADFCGKKVAYAVSIGASKPDVLLSCEDICKSVRAFDKIAVRDENTLEFVRGVLGNECDVLRVVDPTMLLEISDYDEITPPCRENGYILFYYFGAISEKLKKEVREYADKTGKKIVVFGVDDGWADVYVTHDPMQMLSYYKNADLVITNTFHGNVFSLIYNKQFISFGSTKPKVRDLLCEFKLSDRLVDDGGDISALLEERIDFTEANELKKEAKVRSLNYLKSAIKKEEKV